MEQDLFEWLNSKRVEDNGTSLLLAPLSVTQNETVDTKASDEVFVDDAETLEAEEISIDVPNEEDEEISVDTSETIPETLVDNPEPPAPETKETVNEIQERQQTENESPEPVNEDHEWQERATGFTLSLDEPPPELWTNINNDDEEPGYEETDSLQGAAYVQIHGRNFTERLHNAMKHRKERAKLEEPHNTIDLSRIYVQKTIIYCATLLMTLGFALLALWFIWRETPEGMKSRALSLESRGKFDEASAIYQRAYRRYPKDTEFLAELSTTSEKAGHVQTAKTAHEEYVRITSTDNEVKTVPLETKPVPPVKKMTFTDYLDEANHAYNIGMYNRSVKYFFRAHDASPDDIRPYIGVSNAYRMKGMYFDSRRILDEARIKFGRNPDIETGYIFLREAK